MGAQIHSQKKCAMTRKISVASCCLVRCLRRSASDRTDMETKLPSPCSPGSFCQIRTEDKQWAGQGAKGNLHCCCFDWLAWYRTEAKCRTALSSPPLRPLPQNSFTGKKTLSDLTGPACLSPRRNCYIYSSFTGKVSQAIALIHPSADGCSGQSTPCPEFLVCHFPSISHSESHNF